MATHSEPEIVLYDLACNQNVCFSPVVWRIRMLLNYKRIPYKTVFLEFPDIEPTAKEFGLGPNEAAGPGYPKYTVPMIQHVATKKYMMNSVPIAEFLSATYPEPALPLESPLGNEIEVSARKAIGPVFRTSLLPREVHVISPRAAEFFRRTREGPLGHPLEDLLAGDKEEKTWEAKAGEIRAVGELLRTNKAEGPFVLGAKPTYTDFSVAGTLQSARVIDEGVFQRMRTFPGWGDVYEACLPFMERKD